MSYTIAVAGKGGTGKTTCCGMMIDWLCKHNQSPVLAVDADPNSNLNEVLGVEVDYTLGDVREMVAHADDAASIPAGMSKQDFMDYKFKGALIEEDNFDMLVMGHTQGKGCYCFVNGLLQNEIQKLQDNYKYLVVDNEAGLEHIARGILPSIGTLLLVSDCSRRGIQAVARCKELADEMKVKPQETWLIVNRAPNQDLDPGVLEEIAKHGLNLIGVVPQDEMVYQYDCAGKPTAYLPDESKARAAINQICEKLFQKS